MLRPEYHLGLTLVGSFLLVLCAFFIKLLLLPTSSVPSMSEPASSVNSSAASVSTDTELATYPLHQGSLTSEDYKGIYAESIKDPEGFWGRVALEQLAWTRPFDKAFEPGSGKGGFDGMRWFNGGQLNAAVNAVDRHVNASEPFRTALIWEPDDPTKERVRRITYGELLERVRQVAAWLRLQGIKRGDRVTLYMSQVPEAVYAMLGCARIGAVHNVVFGGFGREALRDRINDAQSRIVITASEGKRGGKSIDLKGTVDEALIECPCVQTVLVHCRDPSTEGRLVAMRTGRDVWWHETVGKMAVSDGPLSVPAAMESEDPLFLLYTSGSTGRPKALVHTTGGYLTYASYTHRIVFDHRPDDIMFCTADVGWITGHSYVVYGPLINGATVVLYEGVPTYPSPSRLWEIVKAHGVTQFYTAPTVLRMLKRLGDEAVLDCPSVRVLGSVGEPIDARAWRWYHDVVGKGRCSVVDTYWQTETGGHVLCTVPGTAGGRPGSAGFPFLGIDAAVLPSTTTQLSADSLAGSAAESKGVLVIKKPWPGMARTIHGDHKRFLSTYLEPYPGSYFTGDGAHRDADGYFWIHGRVDDVINVAGHRFSTAEIEGVLTRHPMCAEAAVLGRPDEITGQAICVFCLLKSPEGGKAIDILSIETELKEIVRASIGPIATPRSLFFPSDLPKTRSGKIMRRVLRRILAGEDDLGDLSTLTNPSIIDELRGLVKK